MHDLISQNEGIALPVSASSGEVRPASSMLQRPELHRQSPDAGARGVPVRRCGLSCHINELAGG